MKALLVVLVVSLSLACARFAPLVHDDSETKVAGEYIVVLRTALEPEQVEQHVEELVAEFNAGNDENAILHGTFNIGNLHGFSAKLSQEMLARERMHPDVLYVEANQEVHLDEECKTQQTILWNLDRISETLNDLDGFYHYHASAGAGVTVYVIDTGIFLDHVDFEGRAKFGFSVETNRDDGNGHGTHVASTVGGVQFGVAKKVELVAVKVLLSSGSGTTAGVIAGVNFVTNNALLQSAQAGRKKAAVANMSLGGGNSATLVTAVENSIASGVVYAVAAGNSNADACNFSPANAPSAICVGATTSQDNRASFSNWGTCVDIFAPGNTITAAWIGGATAVKTISGTSMASPHVAGAAALILGRNPDLSPEEVGKTLVDSSTTNLVRDVKGSPNRLLFTTTC